MQNINITRGIFQRFVEYSARALSWIPEQTPCFPLPAKCPVSLFLSLIVSMYGKRLATEIISDVDIAKEYLEPLKNTIEI